MASNMHILLDIVRLQTDCMKSLEQLTVGNGFALPV